MSGSTPLARTVDLDPARNADDLAVAARFHAAYGPGLGRLAAGPRVFHGLPFAFAAEGSHRRWILLDEPVTLDLTGSGPASHLVVAHFCDTWRDDAGVRPAGIAVGHVVPVGEPLARYTVRDSGGGQRARLIRRRFEVNDGILGWGSTAFAAIGHLDNEVLDWRGPHPVQEAGRYAAVGHSGTLTIMPGAYGASQTGMTDFVPSATDDVLLWLHAIELDRATEPLSVTLEPLAGGRPGSGLVVAAMTLFDGSASPLVRSPRVAVRVGGLAFPGAETIGPATAPPRPRIRIDLGTVIRARRARPAGAVARPTPSAPLAARDEPVIGWGEPRLDARAEAATPGDTLVVDLSVGPDAAIDVDGWDVRAAEVLAGGIVREPGGRRSIELLPSPTVPVEVEILDDASGEAIPARVRFTASDGRYLAPVGHRDEINPGFFEDTGGDLILGSAAYAYVSGRFDIGLPVGGVEIEVVAGFDRRPSRTTVEIQPGTRRLSIPLERAIDLHGGRWVTADSHVHFLAPSTALLQAAAEDVDVVNLLAAQWGDLYTNVTDLEWGSTTRSGGGRIVVVGTENRQNVLGHLALLGARRMTTPLASGGPPEGPIAGALEVLLADWADRCRAAGGLTVAAHFPLPYAEIAADIVAGKIEAIETQALSPGLDDPAVLEWYRFLNLGYRLPVLAGTDKMSTEVPVGAVRAYVHLLDDGELTFDRWAAAVRAGRTFVTSGPVLELAVDGHEPGDTIRLSGPARVEVAVRARAAQAVIRDVEVVVNGRVVAATSVDAPTTDLRLDERIEIQAGSWIAARTRSRNHIESAFATSMAAHTSPVYVEVEGRPLIPGADDAAVVEQVMLGTRTWVAELAAIAAPAERARMLAFLDETLAAFRRRIASGAPPR